MPISWEPFVELIQRHRHILLTTHVRPDGDGLGSMRGLAETLEQRGKQVRMVVGSTYPARYQFLNADGKIERFTLPGDAWKEAELVVVMDTGTRNQLGDFAAFLDGLPVDKVVIDHHRTQDDLHALPLVDTSAEATGRLAFEAVRALGGQLTQQSANALFTALAMDTGWFRHSNATSKTFALAAELVQAGAQPDVLYDLLFEQNTLPRFKLMGRVLDRIRMDCDGRVAYTEILVGDYEATGALPQDSEDLVNFTRSVIGVEVGLFFMEQPRGGVKVSFRSRARVDVERVAKQFGGGGHRLASGATLDMPLAAAQERVLTAVRLAVLENNP